MKKKVLIHTLYFAAIGLVFGGVIAIASKVGTLNSFTAGETAVAADVNANFQALKDAINSCSSGMVKVGSVCVDMYEASVWDNITGGTQYGATSDNYPCDNNGNDCSDTGQPAKLIYARSISGVTPSAYITWFQAQQACANSGKRLITNAEWQMAAAGTDDSGTDDSDSICNINDTTVDNTGTNLSCTSNWGTYDMVGNVSEWIADWVQGSSSSWSPSTGTAGTGYGDDWMYGINAAGAQGTGSTNQPSTLTRGGGWNYGPIAGAFALNAIYGPAESRDYIGFRCAQ